ncbi:MAG: type II toxin-antitoxin system YafQ family toxin [Candidatus Dependentiae bacterium]|nr:type II toxin-antitoxin system YafQ family toxin [Candidatus Dependentiae bacterium]
MLERIYQKQFVKDAEKTKKRGKDMNKLSVVIQLLLAEKSLPQKYKNHKLKGDLNKYWECHIEPDWLLMYQKTTTAIILARTGTHSDLF